MQRVTILAGSSQSLISDSGDSEFYHQRQRKEAISAEIKACVDLYFAGRGGQEVRVRLAVSDLIWGVKSKEAPNQLPLEQLERHRSSRSAHPAMQKVLTQMNVQLTNVLNKIPQRENSGWRARP